MLDTRSKSRYNAAILLITNLILLFAILYAYGYPMMSNMARADLEKNAQSGYIQKKQGADLGIELVNMNLGIYKELKEEEAGRVLLGHEVFTQSASPENDAGDEDDLSGVKYLLNLRASSWSRRYALVRDFVEYTVLDGENKILKSRRGIEFDESKMQISVILSYDHLGRMELKDLQIPLQNSQEAVKAVKQMLRRYYDFDPLIGEMQYYSEPENTKHGSEKLHLFFSGPKDMIYRYRINVDAIFGSQSVLGDYVAESYERYWAFINVFLVALFLVAVSAFGLSFWKPYDVADRDLSAIPLELIFLILTFEGVWMGLGLPLHLVGRTMDGSFYAMLRSVGFLEGISAGIVYAVNVLVWAQYLYAVFWCVLAFCGIFHMGAKKYFAHRSLIGMVCVQIFKAVHRFYRSLFEINWSSSDKRQIALVVLGQFLVLWMMYFSGFYGFFSLMVYSLVLFYFLDKRQKRFQEKFQILYAQMDAMSRGDLNFYIEEHLEELEPIKQKLYLINQGLKLAVEKELVSQRSKNELITNMSHDLKTPLTAIIMYINLLRDKNTSESDRTKYLDILDAKAMRLRGLIDDLFEMSMASTGNLKLNIEEVDIVELVKGLRIEYSDRLEEAEIDFRWNLPNKRILLHLDAQKTYRILENLIVNITKYALKSSRAYADIVESKDAVELRFKNISATEITQDPQTLLERFARGDAARNTTGFGLGLAIAKNLVEAQGGEFRIEVQDDFFIAAVRWKKNRYFGSGFEKWRVAGG